MLEPSFNTEESSEEQASSVASEEEEVIHREASMYDNLLMSLRPCSKSVDDACNKRYGPQEDGG
jgi:hypothetical protein